MKKKTGKKGIALHVGENFDTVAKRVANA